jgi:hypothetical protein
VYLRDAASAVATEAVDARVEGVRVAWPDRQMLDTCMLNRGESEVDPTTVTMGTHDVICSAPSL